MANQSVPRDCKAVLKSHVVTCRKHTDTDRVLIQSLDWWCAVWDAARVFGTLPESGANGGWHQLSNFMRMRSKYREQVADQMSHFRSARFILFSSLSKAIKTDSFSTPANMQSNKCTVDDSLL